MIHMFLGLPGPDTLVRNIRIRILFQKVISKNTWKKFVDVLKVTDENNRILVRIRVRIHTKISWIRNTGMERLDMSRPVFDSDLLHCGLALYQRAIVTAYAIGIRNLYNRYFYCQFTGTPLYVVYNLKCHHLLVQKMHYPIFQ